jgi:transposase
MRLRRIHRRLQVLVRQCRKAQGAERDQCLRKLLSTLDQVKAKLDDLESSIREKCAAPDAPKACARADKLIQRLENLKARIDKLEAKIKEHLGSDSSSPSASGASDSGSSSDVDSAASLDAALAAVEQQP